MPARGPVEVAPGVLVATSRFMATNTTVVRAGRRALVVDPGVHPDELDALAAHVGGAGLDVVGGFATHAHWDHVLWHRDLGDVPRWATPTTATRAATRHADLVDEAEAVTVVDEGAMGALVPVVGPLPLHDLGWRGPEVLVVAHDAHEPGHAALHLPELGLLVAGDMGSDVEVPLLAHGVPAPAALLDHHAGLDALAALDHVDVVVTGHGHVCDGAMWRRRLDADRAYLDDLLRARPGDDPRIDEAWLVEADAAMRAGLDKAAWRRWVRDLPPVDAPTSAAVRDGLARFLGPAPGVVATYDALPGEVALDGLLAGPEAGLLAAPAPDGEEPPVLAESVVLPRIADDGRVTWHRATGPAEAHRFGIAQPRADAPEVDPATFDVVLVPGRCFDRRGVRLGRGGGHYDRVLPRLRPGAAVIGVTTSGRVVPRLPAEDHDVPVTHLATEAGVVAVG